jgi:hypothetical protein
MKMLLFVSFAFLFLVAPSRIVAILRQYLECGSPVDVATMTLTVRKLLSDVIC